MVEYTKYAEDEKPDSTASDTAKQPVQEPVASPADESTAEPASPVIVVQTHFESEPISAEYTAVREEFGLRQLLPLESGLPIRRAPPGTYFFSLLPWFESDGPNVEEEFDRFEVHRFASRFKLEFHRSSNDELFMVGFVSVTDAAGVSRLDGTDRELVLTDEWHTEFPVMVRLPLERFVRSSSRDIGLSENVTEPVLDIVLR